MKLTKIIIYPIKSLGGVELQESELDHFGLKYDRRWMLITDNGKALTQRENHSLSQFIVALNNDTVIVRHKEDELFEAKIPLTLNEGISTNVTIWNDTCNAFEAEESINTLFSKKIGESVKLVYLPDLNGRTIDTKYAKNGEKTSFTDGFQILILGEESINFLNSKLEEKITYHRFRPNLIFSGGQPNCEDNFRDFTIGNSHFKGLKQCSRCVITTINPANSKTGKEPLKTLNTYRLINQKVMFGMNVIHIKGSKIRVGEGITQL